jgi:hypothetical protein
MLKQFWNVPSDQHRRTSLDVQAMEFPTKIRREQLRKRWIDQPDAPLDYDQLGGQTEL